MDIYHILEKGEKLHEAEANAWYNGDVVGIARAQQGQRALEDELMSEPVPTRSNSMFYRALKPVLAGASLLTSAIVGAGVANDLAPSLEEPVIYHVEDNSEISEHPLKLYEFSNESVMESNLGCYDILTRTLEGSEVDNELSFFVRVDKNQIGDSFCERVYNEEATPFFSIENSYENYIEWYSLNPRNHPTKKVEKLYSDNQTFEQILTLDLDNMVADKYWLMLNDLETGPYSSDMPSKFKEFYVYPDQTPNIDSVNVTYDNETGKLNFSFESDLKKFFAQTHFIAREDNFPSSRNYFLARINKFSPLEQGFEIDTNDPNQYLAFEERALTSPGNYSLRSDFKGSGEVDGTMIKIYNDKHLEDLILEKFTNNIESEILLNLGDYETKLNNIRWDESDSCWKIDIKLDESYIRDDHDHYKEEGTLCSIPITTEEMHSNYENGSGEARSKIVYNGSPLDDSYSKFRTSGELGNHFNIFHITDQDNKLKVFSYSVVKDEEPVEIFYSLEDIEKYKLMSVDFKSVYNFGKSIYEHSEYFLDNYFSGDEEEFKEWSDAHQTILLEQTYGDALDDITFERKLIKSNGSYFQEAWKDSEDGVASFSARREDNKRVETQFTIYEQENKVETPVEETVTEEPAIEETTAEEIVSEPEIKEEAPKDKTLIEIQPEISNLDFNKIANYSIAGLSGVLALDVLAGRVKGRKEKKEEDDLGKWDATREVEAQMDLNDLTMLATELNRDSEE